MAPTKVNYERPFMQWLYDIMEYHHVQGWPQFERFGIEGGYFNLYTLEHDPSIDPVPDGIDYRRAELVWEDPSLFNINKGDTCRLEIKVPDKFRERIFVTKYHIEREYGGPEEGGWYYDAHYPQETYEAFNLEYAEVLKAKFEKEIVPPEHELSSVLSEGKDYVVVEKHMPIGPVRPSYE